MLTSYRRYPDYKYSPRRRNGPPRGLKKANVTKSIQVIDQPITASQHENYLANSFNQEELNVFIPITTAPHPLEIVDPTFDYMVMQNDLILINTPCYDNLLLRPTMNEPFNQDPSASPSAFSILSQVSGFSPSISSEYDPTISQLPEFFEPFLGTHPYSCGQLDNFMSASSSYQCASNVEYQQVDLSVPSNVRDMSSMPYYMPLPQISFPENFQDHQLPPIVLNRIQNIEGTSAQVLNSSPLFDTTATTFTTATATTTTTTPIAAPLLTQPFRFMNF